MGLIKLLIFVLLFYINPIAAYAQVKNQNNDKPQLVKNTGLAKNNNQRLQLDLLFKINRGEESPVKPGLLVVDSSGGIYVADQGTGSIRYYNKDGELIRTVGQRGMNPGQYQYIKSMGISSEDRLVLLDSFNSKMMVFNQDGSLNEEERWRIPRNFYYDNILLADKDSYISVIREARMGVSRSLNARITYNTYQNENVWQLPAIPDGAIAVVKKESNISSIEDVKHAVKSIVCGDKLRQRIYVIDGDKYRIRSYSVEGKIIQEITRSYERVRLPQEELAVLQDSEIKFKNISSICLSDGFSRLWVKTYETRLSGIKVNYAWDVFTLDGIFSYRFWLDYNPLVITQDHLFTINKNGDIFCFSYKITNN